MRKHWKKLIILAVVIALAVMFCLPGAVLAINGEEPVISAPAISVTKTVDPSEIVLGDTVTITYTYTVTNEGNCRLGGITLVDNVLGLIKAGLGVGGLMKEGEVVILTASTTVTPLTLGPIVNEATVTVQQHADYADPNATAWVNWGHTITANCSVNVVVPTGPESPEGPQGATGSRGSTGATGRSGRDVVRMFSKDGGEEDPWSLFSDKLDKYMLESTTFAGKTTHIIVEIIFMVEQADGSLVFMAK